MGTFCCTLDNRNDPLADPKLDQRLMVSTTSQTPRSEGLHLRVLQWNVLAAGLAWKTCTSFDRRSLLWSHRQELFKQEFFKKDPVTGGLFWDVICLQEVDRHSEIFESEPRYACTYFDYKEQKVALIYNKTKFTDEQSTVQKFVGEEGKTNKEGFIFKVLRHDASGIKFQVFTTALRAKADAQETRVQQAKVLAEAVSNRGQYATILAGGINDEPTSETVAQLRDQGTLLDAHRQFFGFDTVFTMHKTLGKKGIVSETKDYIFYSPQSTRQTKIDSVSGGYQLPLKHELDPLGNPTFGHPSDHYALGFEFLIVKT